MSESNKKMVRRTFEAIWNQANETIFEQRFARDYVGHSLTEIHGPQGGQEFAAAMRGAFPDYHYTIEDEIAEGDRVVQRWTARGTHTGDFQGVPATGKRVTMTGISIYRVANNKLVEGWTSVDLLSLLQQINAVPVPMRP